MTESNFTGVERVGVNIGLARVAHEELSSVDGTTIGRVNAQYGLATGRVSYDPESLEVVSAEVGVGRSISFGQTANSPVSANVSPFAGLYADATGFGLKASVTGTANLDLYGTTHYRAGFNYSVSVPLVDWDHFAPEITPIVKAGLDHHPANKPSPLDNLLDTTTSTSPIAQDFDRSKDYSYFSDDRKGPAADASARPGSFRDPAYSHHPTSAPSVPQPGFSNPNSTPYSDRSLYDEDGPGVSLDQGSPTRGNESGGDDRDYSGASSSGGSSNGASGSGLGTNGGHSDTSSFGGDSGRGRTDTQGRTDSDPNFDGPVPIVLDLDGTGVELTELSDSTVFIDSSGDGLLNRTAWAAAGNGVLFYDADGDGTISEKREYVFTEWDPTATSDIEALRAVFDTNGDGVFDANDDAWGDFRVLVTQDDGSLVAMTLDELGITSIDLTADATNIELPDGSVITGTTTFTWSDGTTGTVADTTLVSDSNSYRIEESEVIDGAGVRTHIQTGYGADGAISFVITSVTTADGSSITNSYDTNGDGVVDQVQSIITVSNPDGSESRTVTNKVGSDFATGILTSETKTTTSADGNTITIERDSTGGGWYDQTEVRTTHADDSMTIVTTDIGPDGSVIRSSTETVSADGLTRTDAIDEDGDGGVDLTITHTIVINADGSRSETIEYFNEDGSLRSSVTESVSADGQTKTIARDLDGDGDTDVQEELNITVNADGSTDSTLTVKNGDGSTRSTSTHDQSEDALTKSSAVDQDGDGDVDLTTVEVTTIHADDSRETATTQTNTDGSIRSMINVTLGSDQVSSETWIDHNQDGVFQATDLSRSVTVDAVTGERTTTSWTRNADGSFSANSVSVSSEDGLTVSTVVDADGDGDADMVVSDVTIDNADGTSTRTITERAQDGTLISEEVMTTSADGLTVTRLTDADGDGSIDGKSVSVSSPNADGSVTHTEQNFAGDQTTVLSETTVTQSADRRITDTVIDANGDGANDTVLRSEKHADGSMTEVETRLNADGDVLYQQQTDVSADGLTVTVKTDLDGNGVVETKTTQDTVLNADGGRTTTTSVLNGDDSLRSQTITTVSDDGLVATTTEDLDGDGAVDATVISTTELLADGARRTTEEIRAGDDTVLSSTEFETSDDGLEVETRADNDGDGVVDIVSTSLTTLNGDGSTTVTSTVTDVSGSDNDLRSQSVVITSDDGRDALETSDIDGDGDIDLSVHRVIGDDGTVTVTETAVNSGGSLQSQMVSTTSDDGLESTTRYDADGDGVYERSMDSATVLNADGSTTQTSEDKTETGVVYRRVVTDSSSDGRTTTTREDWDNDGDDDLTTTQFYDLSVSGVETTSVTQTAADGSILNTASTVISADGRAITHSVDADGNGVDDMVSVSSTDDSGRTTTNTNYYSNGGGLEATATTSVSGDGLTTTYWVDRNGDGKADHVIDDVTVLAANGSSTRTVTHSTGRHVGLGEEVYHTSDDGLHSRTQFDLNGDGLFDYTTTSNTVLESDGDITVNQTTVDETFQVQSEIETHTSGDGLRTTVETDFSGDGTPNRISSLVVSANGGLTETISEFGAGTSLQNSHVRTVSADGLTETTSSDLDGDGEVDREVNSVINGNREVITTIQDLAEDSSVESEIVETVSANGMTRTLELDIDGDGDIDLTRTTEIGYDALGNMVTTFTELGANVEVTFEETQTVSADGLLSTSTFDLDGDGKLDGTARNETILNDDGSQTTTNTVEYADGELRSEEIVSVSRDGRTIVQSEDFDGNGIADKITEVEIRADGEQIVTETAFNRAGYETNSFVTTTSSDGLIQTILRNGNEQTIVKSAIDNGSYTWDNGAEPDLGVAHVFVSHEVDVLGVETWSVAREWQYEDRIEEVDSNGQVVVDANGEIQYVVEQRADGLFYYVLETKTDTSFKEIKLDQAAKARVLEEAARIFDTILDRDADFTELEILVDHIEDGQLDKAGLTSALIESGEFGTRYGELSDAEFVTQVYLNAFGRAPSLTELDEHLQEIEWTAQIAEAINPEPGYDGRPVAWRNFALEISESAEHLVVGNGHMATNNFDVILNPAEYERSLDRAYIENVVKSLVDVAYDRDATDQELEYLSNLLLWDVDNPSDLADKLLSLSGELQGTATNSLNDLSGEDFVEQAYLNAFGRVPTQAELTTWSDNLANGLLTKGEFVAALAQSVEHKASGYEHVATESGTVQAQSGTSSDETLTGGNGQNYINALAGNDTLIGQGQSDVLIGGKGDDQLWGGANGAFSSENGNDTYVWARGDGNDTINDFAGSNLETDVLRLTDINSDQIFLVRPNNSDDLKIVIPGDNGVNETITIARRFENWTKNYGIEAIEFADGEVWTLEDIFANVFTYGDDLGNSLIGSTHSDTLLGLAGDDHLEGKGGGDTLTGGIGEDVLFGGSGADQESNGDDTYVWSRGDGNDSIRDYASSTTELDRLVLTDVPSDKVLLVRPHNSFDLKVVILNEDGDNDVITIDRRFEDPAKGYGIEVIEFSDGVMWSLDDILANTVTFGTDASDTLNGSAYSDNLLGGTGGDVLEGKGGDDTLTGEAGDDILFGGGISDQQSNGNDTYIWSRGDGDDAIGDYASSLTEVDRLVLTDVASDKVLLVRSQNSVDLNVVVLNDDGNNDVITIDRRFEDPGKGYGIEVIEFADGAIWTLDDILSNTFVLGTPADETRNGTAYADNLFGDAGNDVLEGKDGDDTLTGGTGEDILLGGGINEQQSNGNDTYVWSRGDGDDAIGDYASSLTEVDRLVLNGVDSGDVSLWRPDGSADLEVIISGPDGDEVITIDRRFEDHSKGFGIEVIEFADGVVIEINNHSVAQTEISGTEGNNTLNGSNFADLINGEAGNDVLEGKQGDDTLTGGTGDDILFGGGIGDQVSNGNDTYIWSRGDGDDGIGDYASSLTEVDRLVLTDVDSDKVLLVRPKDSVDLKIVVLNDDGANDVITVDRRFEDPTKGYGIEVIEFANGVIWTLNDILSNTVVLGTTSNDTINGTAYSDNLLGEAGNDILGGKGGNDTLTGGTGNDILLGGGVGDQTSNGSDTYVWSRGDGDDAIGDYASSLTEVDRLVLSDVASDKVLLVQSQNSVDLKVVVLNDNGDNDVITIDRRFEDPAKGYGVEVIEFSDGVIWTLNDILSNTVIFGNSGNDTLIGTAGADYLFGAKGNDILVGHQGDDTIQGGTGNDALFGGSIVEQAENGSDTYIWSTGDGDDSIADLSTSEAEIDRLVLTDVNSDNVVLVRPNGSNDLKLVIIGSSANKVITIDRQYENTRKGFGIEEIEFSDGVVWSLNDIVANTSDWGNPGDDTLHGTGGGNYLFGYQGNDIVVGHGGNDVIAGGTGNDALFGGSIVDQTNNGSDTYVWSYGDGNDGIADLSRSKSEVDRLYLHEVDSGAVTLHRANGSNDLQVRVAGPNGNETITIDRNFENPSKGYGIEKIEFSSGVVINVLNAATPETSITGTVEDNVLNGSNFNDRINGKAGDDVIAGGAGNDFLTGGQGADTFVFHTGGGNDTILDFEDGVDQIHLGNIGLSFADLGISENANSVTVDLAGQGNITIEDVSASSLSEEDFVF